MSNNGNRSTLFSVAVEHASKFARSEMSPYHQAREKDFRDSFKDLVLSPTGQDLQNTESESKVFTPPVSSGNDFILGKREINVMRLLGEGLSDVEIGERLGVGQSSVRRTIMGTIKKMGANHRAHAMALFAKKGLL